MITPSVERLENKTKKKGLSSETNFHKTSKKLFPEAEKSYLWRHSCVNTISKYTPNIEMSNPFLANVPFL